MRFEIRKTEDGSNTVFDREAGECFKSRHAARLEAEHVFFVPAVLENPAYGSETFEVLELGFGLGTNFLHFFARGFKGRFLSIERDFTGAQFFLEHENEPALKAFVEKHSFDQSGMQASLVHGDFFTELRRLSANGYRAHAVLFDPFSPKANPEAWVPDLMKLVFEVLHPGGRVVTYSVSRAAKDACAAAGLITEKRDLPSALHKRSALLAIRA